MSERKHRATRRAHYRIRPTAPRARFARSAEPDPPPPPIRDPQPFHVVDAADQAFIDEQLRMADELVDVDVDAILAGEVVDER